MFFDLGPLNEVRPRVYSVLFDMGVESGFAAAGVPDVTRFDADVHANLNELHLFPHALPIPDHDHSLHLVMETIRGYPHVKL